MMRVAILAAVFASATAQVAAQLSEDVSIFDRLNGFQKASLESTFERFDENGDGIITHKEVGRVAKVSFAKLDPSAAGAYDPFTDLEKKLGPRHPDFIRWRNMDTNADKVISRSEWQEQAFPPGDLNCDGKLTREEYAAYLLTPKTKARHFCRAQ